MGNAKMQTDDTDLIEFFVSQNLLSVVPAGENDDFYIIEYAKNNNGYILSNDLFEDHILSFIESESGILLLLLLF